MKCEVIIRYTQQTSEDSWSVRHKSKVVEIVGLDEADFNSNNSSYDHPHIVDVNKLEVE